MRYNCWVFWYFERKVEWKGKWSLVVEIENVYDEYWIVCKKRRCYVC